MRHARGTQSEPLARRGSNPARTTRLQVAHPRRAEIFALPAWGSGALTRRFAAHAHSPIGPIPLSRFRLFRYGTGMMTRRDALKTVALTAGALTLAPSLLQGGEPDEKLTYPYKVPDLGYPYDALEPHIDTLTMQIHHDKHHAAYVENLNKALAEADPKFQKLTLEEILTSVDQLPEKIRTVVHNNTGGHYNHSLFWLTLKKNEGGKPTGELATAIDKSFSSFDDFKKKLSETSTKVFGSGWGWLVLNGKELEIASTPNQDSPISKHQVPLLGIDVWEHSYYLKHQNRRPQYLEAFWSVVNWDFVEKRYKAAVA
jgi:Fe-Mn family superoxide dismutase